MPSYVDGTPAGAPAPWFTDRVSTVPDAPFLAAPPHWDGTWGGALRYGGEQEDRT